MTEEKLKNTINNIIEHDNVFASAVLPFDSELTTALRENKIILLGAKNDHGNRKVEGFAKGWFWENSLQRIKEILNMQLSVIKIPLNLSRDFIFISCVNNERLSLLLDEAELNGKGTVQII